MEMARLLDRHRKMCRLFSGIVLYSLFSGNHYGTKSVSLIVAFRARSLAPNAAQIYSENQ